MILLNSIFVKIIESIEAETSNIGCSSVFFFFQVVTSIIIWEQLVSRCEGCVQNASGIIIPLGLMILMIVVALVISLIFIIRSQLPLSYINYVTGLEDP